MDQEKHTPDLTAQDVSHTTSRYTVVIPAYKPDERLWRLATEVLEAGYRLIVVDDGGGADYLPIFEGLDKRAVILRHPENRGKGAAIKTGLSHLLALTGDFDPAEPPLVGLVGGNHHRVAGRSM